MKLHADPRNASLNTVTGYSAAGIEINAVAFPHSVVVSPEGPVASWGVQDIAALDADTVSKLADGQPELVVLGTGRRQRFPHPRVAAQLAGQRIGLEVMDTAAACRTYNILMAEGRRVVGAFIIEPELSS
ncbi:Mth938-like domain-containing protein [Piscinibacterium candidicorallinum]|uniref:Mth938-like domain-containing protein n=1 Tax=Piscinibacterium candidicorallinum TaxID=1793872 RepID=A0ABV7H3U9_9BURK